MPTYFKFLCVLHVLVLNNTEFSDFAERIYHVKLDIKDINETHKSASYLDLHPWPGQTKGNKIDICWFSTTHAAFKS